MWAKQLHHGELQPSGHAEECGLSVYEMGYGIILRLADKFIMITMFSFAGIKHWVQKQLWEEIFHLAYMFWSHPIMNENQGRTWKSENEGGPTKECYLLVCPTWPTQFASLYNPAPLAQWWYLP